MSDKLKRTKYIADKIIELRNSVEWSQSELARRSKVTSAAISQIEKGDRTPSLLVLRKLADALNVPLSELTGDSSSSSKELNDKAQTFFRKFGCIEKLSAEDQKIIQSIIQRLREQKDDKR